jgi:hypothetical protein
MGVPVADAAAQPPDRQPAALEGSILHGVLAMDDAKGARGPADLENPRPAASGVGLIPIPVPSDLLFSVEKRPPQFGPAERECKRARRAGPQRSVIVNYLQSKDFPISRPRDPGPHHRGGRELWPGQARPAGEMPPGSYTSA